MILSKEEIWRWANISDSKINFKEGEQIINAGHIIYCWKNIDFNGSVRLSSNCLSKSSWKGEPHEIKGEVSKSGRILSMTCTFKAGLEKNLSMYLEPCFIVIEGLRSHLNLAILTFEMFCMWCRIVWNKLKQHERIT